MTDFKRETAIPCKIIDITKGHYVKREGWEPNYVQTDKGNVSRVRFFGVVVSVSENSFVIDDKTSTIEVRSFDEGLKIPEIGKIVLVIGRPREYDSRIYLVGEVVKIYQNPAWIKLHMLQTGKENPALKRKMPEIQKVQDEANSKVDITDSLLSKIDELDTGYGVKVEDLIKHFDKSAANSTITQLLESGEIFEIKPGIVKTI